MWPFKKKELPQLLRLTPEQVKKVLLMARKPCPHKECSCNDCPSLGKCGFETDMYKSRACFVDNPLSPRIKDSIGLGCGCSWKKHLKGELNEEKERTTESRGIITYDSSNGGDFYGLSQVSSEGRGDQ